MRNKIIYKMHKFQSHYQENKKALCQEVTLPCCLFFLVFSGLMHTASRMCFSWFLQNSAHLLANPACYLLPELAYYVHIMSISRTFSQCFLSVSYRISIRHLFRWLGGHIRAILMGRGNPSVGWEGTKIQPPQPFAPHLQSENKSLTEVSPSRLNLCFLRKAPDNISGQKPPSHQTRGSARIKGVDLWGIQIVIDQGEDSHSQQQKQ